MQQMWGKAGRSSLRAFLLARPSLVKRIVRLDFGGNGLGKRNVKMELGGRGGGEGERELRDGRTRSGQVGRRE
jgi:hypothetical protein